MTLTGRIIAFAPSLSAAYQCNLTLPKPVATLPFAYKRLSNFD